MFRIVCCAVVTLAFSQTAAAGFLTYDLKDYPALQNGYTLSGSITTDGTIGDLFASNIVSWSVTITPSVGSPISFSSASPTNLVQTVGHVVADATAITLAAATGPTNSDNQLSLINQPYLSLTYARLSFSGSPFNIYQTQITQQDLGWGSHPAEDALGGDPWVLAGIESSGTSIATPVPPSWVMVACGAIPAVLITRRRKAAPTPA